MNKWRTGFISLLAGAAILGVVASVYALLAHYDVTSTEFCSVSDTFDCDLVNKSKYSKILGIPVALLGIFAYVFFFLSALVYAKRPSELLMQVMIFGAVFSMLFSLYLTYIEAFVLFTWCMICLASLLATVLVNIAVFGLNYLKNKS